MDLVEKLRMAVDVATPGDGIGLEIGETVDDRHAANSVAAIIARFA
jgi:hypothetical protein